MTAQETLRSTCQVGIDFDEDSEVVCGMEADSICKNCGRDICGEHTIECEICQNPYCSHCYGNHSHEDRSSTLDSR
jgi:predicted sulfurtransferase